MDEELKSKLQMLSNEVKPQLCDMANNCQYQQKDPNTQFICEVYVREVKEENTTWCSCWFSIEPFRLHVFMMKYGGSK